MEYLINRYSTALAEVSTTNGYPCSLLRLYLIVPVFPFIPVTVAPVSSKNGKHSINPVSPAVGISFKVDNTVLASLDIL